MSSEAWGMHVWGPQVRGTYYLGLNIMIYPRRGKRKRERERDSVLSI